MKFKIGLVVVLALVATAALNAQDVDRQARIMDVFGWEDDAGEHHHLETDFLNWFHNPSEGITQTFDMRLRSVFSQNIDTLNGTSTAARGDKFEYQRYRFRYGLGYEIDENIDFNMRWVYEFRTWDEPARKTQSWDGDEILPDRFNLTVRNLFDMPLTMVIGRQDIILGGGWLVLDGTPLDGSRTIFFDALRLTLDMPENESKLDAILVHQNAASDAWLKPINDRDRYVAEQDETAVILWLTNNSIENTKLEAYYIYKNDNAVQDAGANFPTSAWSRDAEIHTLGGAISGTSGENWKYRGDIAIQMGERQARSQGAMADLQAWGAKAYLGYGFNDEKKSEVHAVYEYLSGDDPSTSDDEQFDPLWGEWPQFSELLIYTYSRETAIAEVTNLQRFGIGHSFMPNKKLTVKTDYNLLWADENNGATSGAFAFDSSANFRGQLFTLWLKYNCCKKVVAHTVFEYFFPGEYYADGNDDEAYFLRFNFEYSF